MMDNLQEAYTSYQQALYHLRDPKVVTCRPAGILRLIANLVLGTKTVVWYWYLV